jgi:3-oxoadipate enol-lactonase
MKLPFEELGSGPPVILLHGFPLSRTMWQPNVGAIADAGLRVITPDFPGFGENTSFADINTMEDMAKGVAELLSSLKIERAIIGGLSMGGYVTFALYAAHPELFAGLVLCDTTSVADTDEKRKGRFELIEKIERQGAQALVENMLPNLIADSTKENDP